MAEKPRKSRIPLTQDLIAALQYEAQRSGIGPASLIKTTSTWPASISASIIRRWLTGGVKSADASAYQYVLKAWRAQPDFETAFVSFDEEIRARMDFERSRTGASITMLLSGRTDLPHGLTAPKAKSFYDGLLTKLPRSHVSYVLDLWEKLPTLELVDLTLRDIARLKDHQTRTGMNFPAALRRSECQPPLRFNPEIVARWLSGKEERAPKDHLEFVVSVWASLPDTAYVQIDEDLRTLMQAEIQRTNAGPSRLIRSTKNPPPGLTAGIIRDWILGRTIEAPRSNVAFVLQRWRSLPSLRLRHQNCHSAYAHGNCHLGSLIGMA